MSASPKTRLAIWSSAVRQKLWQTMTPYYFKAVGQIVPRILNVVKKKEPHPGRDIRVVGLFSTATGTGHSARLCASDLRHSGHNVTTFSLSRLFSVDDRVPAEQFPRASAQSSGISIYHVNPPMMLIGMLAAGIRQYRRDINVAYWAWELPQLPREWHKALPLIDAVLVPSTFCQSTVAAATDKPVLVVPHPVPRVAPRAIVAQAAPAPFRVLTVFNCGSSLYRKNPWASIRAFKLAFGNDPGAELILKIADGRQHLADLARLRAVIGDAPNIRIIDELMDVDALDALLCTADAYISLHRSEGFGLTVAEAMMRQVPVVVTNWSGTTDFCPPSLAYGVDYELVPVDDPHPVFYELRGAHWADPSAEAAARHLVSIRQDPQAANARAAQLRTRLIEHLAANTYAKAVATIFERYDGGARRARHEPRG